MYSGADHEFSCRLGGVITPPLIISNSFNFSDDEQQCKYPEMHDQKPP